MCSDYSIRSDKDVINILSCASSKKDEFVTSAWDIIEEDEGSFSGYNIIPIQQYSIGEEVSIFVNDIKLRSVVKLQSWMRALITVGPGDWVKWSNSLWN